MNCNFVKCEEPALRHTREAKGLYQEIYCHTHLYVSFEDECAKIHHINGKPCKDLIEFRTFRTQNNNKEL